MKFPHLLLAALFALSPNPAQAQDQDIDAIFEDLGVEVSRKIDADIALPATAAEYEATGKNAILMLQSASAISTELPLRSVYAQTNGVRIPLQRLALLDKLEPAPGSTYTTQISFYLLPVYLMKLDTHILADFSGERRGFGFSTFSKKEISSDIPAFIRLDEYDQPSEPDMNAVGAMIAREYPDIVNQR